MRGDTYLPGCLEFLEAVYAWQLGDEPWLRGLIEAMVRLWGNPRWACAYEYDASDGQLRVDAPLIWGGDAVVEQVIVQGLARAGSQIAHLYRTVSVGFGRPIGGIDDVTGEGLAKASTLDYFGLNGLNPSGRGCFVGVGAERTTLTAEEMVVYQRLAAHLSSAYRCRQRLKLLGTEPLDDSEAVLQPDGRLLHARGAAEDAAARNALHEAAASMETVRRSTKLEPTSRWRPRVKGRWTLVDAHDRRGDRFVVARENQTPALGLESLTEREQQVVAVAAAGRSPKEIAYELGISHATTRVLLSRAYARLGVRSIEELFALPSIRALRGEAD